MKWPNVAAAGLAMVMAGLVFAEGFSLSPLKVTISPREPSSSVVVENTGEGPLVIQVRPLAWSQRDGKDVREETRDLIVNPPIFKLARGEQQLVRFASRLPPPREDERTFRAVFTEVPPREAPQGHTGFRIALAMDIPVIFEPVAAAVSRPATWSAERTEKGLRLRAENPGNGLYRINDVQFSAAGSALHRQGFVAVLPRSWLAIELPAPPAGTSAIQLTAHGSDNQPVAVAIPLPPPL